MKYFILIEGIIAIIIVTLINFYPDKVKDFLYTYIYKKDYIIAIANDYYLDSDYEYIKNYTDDVSNKEELIDYIYYVVNTGSEYADGSCKKEYKECLDDLKIIADDKELLTLFNNYVHPYNTFKTIYFAYTDNGDFSITIEHIYSKEDIAEINYVVRSQLQTLITENMTNVDKIRAIHDYIIDHTKYDTLKIDNIDDDTYRSKTAYGVLIQGYGICSGYADTMSIFLNELGIKNYRISNDSHIWNLIYVNGKWVHLDATWDDPVSEFNEDRDTYFLISTDELKKLDDGTHEYNANIFREAY